MWAAALHAFLAVAFVAAVACSRGSDLSWIELGGRRFNVNDSAGLAALGAAAEHGLSTNPPSRVRRGLTSLRALVEAESRAPESQRKELRRNMAEVAAALGNNDRPPVPPAVDIVQMPFVHYRYVSGRVGLGREPAANVARDKPGAAAGESDPEPSTFWKPPKAIDTQDLAIGFGRASRPRFEDVIWEYDSAKRSYGANAGFKARHGSSTIKIKFGETRSEPFVARVFHALGYHVEPTDYSPGLKVRYDRRLFDEFNSRKPINTRITMLGFVPLGTVRFQPRHDALAFIARAVTRDGTSLQPDELRERMAAGRDADIDYLITVPANVQLENEEEGSIGPWDFGQLDHARRRELRGAGLLAAWLGWFDSRFENTRLVVSKTDPLALKHVFADLGGGLGKSTGLAGWRGEWPEQFPDRFTSPEIRQGPGRMTIPFRVRNFRPIEPTPAFEEMTLDDARWMARLIAQLTEAQIVDALRASGFTAEETETFRRKLISRRTHLLRDLRLEMAP